MRNIQCKKCFFFVNEWCPKKIDSPDPDLIRDCQYYKTKTNADRIRSMTDEQLAETMWSYLDCGACPARRSGCGYMDKCQKSCLEWLKEEVTT